MIFYRYEWRTYAEKDYDGEYCLPSFPNPKLELSTFDLIKETPMGYWIGIKYLGLKHKWISKTSRKKYAYLTKEEALYDFILRTENRIKILDWNIKCCEIALNDAKALKL